MNQRLRQIFGQPQRHALPERIRVAFERRKTIERMRMRIIQTVRSCEIDLRRDRLNHANIEEFRVRRHNGFKLKILRRTGQTRGQRDELKHLRRRPCRIDQAHDVGADRATGCAVDAVSRSGRWAVQLNLGRRTRIRHAAEIPAAFRHRRHRRELIDRVAVPLRFHIHENKCFVAPVVNVRNPQRPAHVSAEALLPRSRLRKRAAPQRIRRRIQRRIAVSVVNTEMHAIDSLTHHALRAPKRTHSLRAAAGSSSPARPASAPGSASTASATAATAKSSTAPGPPPPPPGPATARPAESSAGLVALTSRSPRRGAHPAGVLPARSKSALTGAKHIRPSRAHRYCPVHHERIGSRSLSQRTLLLRRSIRVAGSISLGSVRAALPLPVEAHALEAAPLAARSGLPLRASRGRRRRRIAARENFLARVSERSDLASADFGQPCSARPRLDAEFVARPRVLGAARVAGLAGVALFVAGAAAGARRHSVPPVLPPQDSVRSAPRCRAPAPDQFPCSTRRTQAAKPPRGNVPRATPETQIFRSHRSR